MSEGANMLYVAMFDEMDEDTAIFKTSNTPPASGKSVFISNAAMPPDHYLWLTGRIATNLKSGATAVSETPRR